MATLENDLMKEYRRQCHESAKARRQHWRRIRQMLKLAIGKTNYLKLKCRDIPDPSSANALTRYGVLEINVFGRSIIVDAAYPEDGEDTVAFSIQKHGGVSPCKIKSGIFAPEKMTRVVQQKNFDWFLRCIASELQDEIHLELEKALQSVGSFGKRYPNGREYDRSNVGNEVLDFLNRIGGEENSLVQSQDASDVVLDEENQLIKCKCPSCGKVWDIHLDSSHLMPRISSETGDFQMTVPSRTSFYCMSCHQMISVDLAKLKENENE